MTVLSRVGLLLVCVAASSHAFLVKFYNKDPLCGVGNCDNEEESQPFNVQSDGCSKDFGGVGEGTLVYPKTLSNASYFVSAGFACNAANAIRFFESSSDCSTGLVAVADAGESVCISTGIRSYLVCCNSTQPCQSICGLDSSMVNIPEEEPEEGLPTGAIAGIILACGLIIALLSVMYVFANIRLSSLSHERSMAAKEVEMANLRNNNRNEHPRSNGNAGQNTAAVAEDVHVAIAVTDLESGPPQVAEVVDSAETNNKKNKKKKGKSSVVVHQAKTIEVPPMEEILTSLNLPSSYVQTLEGLEVTGEDLLFANDEKLREYGIDVALDRAKMLTWALEYQREHFVE